MATPEILSHFMTVQPHPGFEEGEVALFTCSMTKKTLEIPIYILLKLVKTSKRRGSSFSSCEFREYRISKVFVGLCFENPEGKKFLLSDLEALNLECFVDSLPANDI